MVAVQTTHDATHVCVVLRRVERTQQGQHHVPVRRSIHRADRDQSGERGTRDRDEEVRPRDAGGCFCLEVVVGRIATRYKSFVQAESVFTFAKVVLVNLAHLMKPEGFVQSACRHVLRVHRQLHVTDSERRRFEQHALHQRASDSSVLCLALHPDSYDETPLRIRPRRRDEDVAKNLISLDRDQKGPRIDLPELHERRRWHRLVREHLVFHRDHAIKIVAFEVTDFHTTPHPLMSLGTPRIRSTPCIASLHRALASGFRFLQHAPP